MVTNYQTIMLGTDMEPLPYILVEAPNSTDQIKYSRFSQTKSRAKSALAVISGGAVAYASQPFLKDTLQTPFSEKFVKLADEYTGSREKFVEISENMVKRNHLDKKGFNLIFADHGLEEILTPKFEKLFSDLYANPKLKFLFNDKNEVNEVTKNIMTRIRPKLHSIEKGRNAMFLKPFNLGMTSPKGSLFMPHEIGHAINYNRLGFKGKILHSLLTGGTPLLAIPLILLISLLHTKKENDNKSEIEKTKDFVQDNAGKLTFASFIPLLHEEASASNHAFKAVANDLAKSEMKAFKRIHAAAFGTYLMTAVAAGLSVALGVYVTKKISERNKEHHHHHFIWLNHRNANTPAAE